MIAALWTVATFSCAAPLPAKSRPEDDATKPKLIVKGKDFFVHVLPRRTASLWATPELFPFQSNAEANYNGIVVFHTSVETGEMKILASGSTSAICVPMGLDRIFRNYRLVAGIAADQERLYVLLWHAHTEEMVGMTKPCPAAAEGKFKLLVFRLSKGDLIHSLELNEGNFPKEPLQEKGDRGPLELRADGVACFGVTFTFNGTQLLKQQFFRVTP